MVNHLHKQFKHFETVFRLWFSEALSELDSVAELPVSLCLFYLICLSFPLCMSGQVLTGIVFTLFS